MTITNDNRRLMVRLGPLEIDWPKSVGYFSAIGLAVAFDLIAPPVGLFIAVIPALKLFNRRGQPWPVRIVADALDGAAKPVGGDSEAIVRFAESPPRPLGRRRAGPPHASSADRRRRSLAS
jgi:hypothetical protein